MQYRCKYFKIKELVNPAFLTTNEDILWRLFDDRLLKAADAIREKYGAITINSGSWVDCGLRKMDSKNGAMLSSHKFGRALDLHILSIEKESAKITDPVAREKFKSGEYNKVRENLMLDHKFDCLSFEQNSKEHPKGITWLHISVENRANRLFNA